MFPPLDVVADPVARARLDRYLECLQHWAPKINLTGAETKESAFNTLVLPILGAEPLLIGPVIDVGSGNGSPGLILAALRPDLGFTLLEPRAKRWAFLREAARQMDLKNVVANRERSHDYQGAPARSVTVRAVGIDPGALRRLLSPGGCVFVFGGPAIPQTDLLRLPSGASLQRRCFT